jgi:DNA primase large subunit
METGFTKNDLAKYPFLKETARYITPLELQIDDLASASMDLVLKRAEERVTLAITSLRIRDLDKKVKDENAEILSFPVAVLLVTATDSSLIKKRYALAEAKQATSELLNESKNKILKVAHDFNWKITLAPTEKSEVSSDYIVHFTDYLRNTSHLHDRKWKLSNSILANGSVYLKKQDTVRLLQEEIRKRIEKRLESAQLDKYPEAITVLAEKLKALASESIGQSEISDYPKIIVQEAFPPCINALYDAASKSHHLSHTGRFTLVSFLVNIGMTAESLNELFKTFSDYNERLTRYQIEHIAGERGSGTRYTPPQCSVLQTHGVCKNSDDLCRRIYHPLAYYKRKQKIDS